MLNNTLSGPELIKAYRAEPGKFLPMIIFEKKAGRNEYGGKNYPSISTFTDRNGNGFFSATMCVGVDDDPALIAGAPILPWSAMKNCRKTECRKAE